ncbi:muconolactone Delta-isomerase [Litoreibacter roseus]|uniref:Muconolactone Delta-isomerase n=1 Tax=Litoreibacter roseus TaxID=2601869 RepID=A0A6N6JLM1_9RHOB|nr:muconolactone Delta-isomerase family protein [Litoreibacter roseus]GFE66178.1 muconolactone Delta-isomerase [Litoreibacter roseus]
MLFLVRMDVCLPSDLSDQEAETLKHQEKLYAQKLQCEGTWLHLWRVAGHYANVSVFSVEDLDTLHTALTGLPFFPFLEIEITPLCAHPSRVAPE